MRILINCPGGWSHGLDSPERGEGRWAQNLARCLSKVPEYEVSACSGGTPTWGRGLPASVHLLSEHEAGGHGPYDLYFDASWYENKPTVAVARANFHVHFGYETRLGPPFPPNHYIVYALSSSAAAYEGPDRSNADRTFYLPAPFAEAMAPPNLTRRAVITTVRTAIDDQQKARFDLLYHAVTRLRAHGHEVPLVWIGSNSHPTPQNAQDRVLRKEATWGLPYHELRTEIAQCGLNAALDGWASILDATALGVPSLAWEGGIDPRPVEVATQYGLSLSPDTDVVRLADVLSRLLFNANLRLAYMRDMQAAFSDHIEPVTLCLFRAMAAKALGHKKD